MTPAAIETVPPEKMTNRTSRTPMQVTGRTQQCLKNEPNAFMTFTFLMPLENNAATFIDLSHFRTYESILADTPMPVNAQRPRENHPPIYFKSPINAPQG